MALAKVVTVAVANITSVVIAILLNVAVEVLLQCLLQSMLECVYWEFAPLYSCVCTLMEWYRPQNCDNGGITTTH